MQRNSLVSHLSQNDAIYTHLQAGETLTPLDALNKFGCFRLSARIKDLKERGHNITCEIVKTSDGKRVGRYSLTPPTA